LTYFGHRELTLESASHPVINTLGFSPCLLDALVAVGLMTPVEVTRKSVILAACDEFRCVLEWLGAFFNNWRLDGHENLCKEHVRTYSIVNM
jgi:hypothetical protein